MKNLVQMKGPTRGVTAPANVVGGRPFVAGNLVLIPVKSANSGEQVAVYRDGTFELDKGSTAIALGTKLYWDAANNRVTTTAGSNKVIGHAINASSATDTKAIVDLVQNN